VIHLMGVSWVPVNEREQQSIAPTAADNVGTGNPMYYSNDSLWGALNLPWLDHPRVR